MSKTDGKRSLASTHRALALQWHPERNGELRPSDVTWGSGKDVWWQCPIRTDHVWRAAVQRRTGGAGCPYCSGRYVTPETSLAAIRPDLAAEWHPTKNGALRPSEVMPGSGRRIWWRCSRVAAHVWRTSAAHRTAMGNGCPYCSGRRTPPGESLVDLRPDLAAEWHPTKNGARVPDDVRPSTTYVIWWRCGVHPALDWRASVKSRTAGAGCPHCGSLAALHPRLAREWHPTRNGPLGPRDVLPGSSKRVWWRCRDAHEWRAAVCKRTSGQGCPFCAGNLATAATSLAGVHPEVAKEWHPTRNAPLTPEQIRPQANRKVWWQCAADPPHVWQALVANRTKRGTGCPICSGYQLTDENCLAARSPLLASEWHPTKNGTLGPADVRPGTHRKVWWRCSRRASHVWCASVRERYRRGHGCPFCSGQRVCADNCLRRRRPALAREWHPTRNGELGPSDVLPGSNKKVWWRCRFNPHHEWQAQVCARSRGRGCPFCAGHHAPRKKRKRPKLKVPILV